MTQEQENKLFTLLESLKDVPQDVKAIKGDIEGIKNDIQEMKAHIKELRITTGIVALEDLIKQLNSGNPNSKVQHSKNTSRIKQA